MKLKRHYKKILCGILAIIILLSFASCASDTKSDTPINDDTIYSEQGSINGIFDFSAGNGTSSAPSVENNKGEMLEGSEESANTSSSGSGSVSTNRKVIETYSMRIETKEYDKLQTAINDKINSLGGYIESSSTDKNGNFRYSHLTIRVPQTSGSEFAQYIHENSNVVFAEVKTKDVTLEYSDVQSKINAYKIEKAQLEELMTKATNLTEILQLQDRLTEVIYEIESRESQLRTYDNLVDYTTINLTINEVEIETIVEEQTIWAKMKTNLVNGFKNIGNFFVNTFVFIVSAIPYLLCFAIIAIIIVVIIKTRKKKKQKK